LFPKSRLPFEMVPSYRSKNEKIKSINRSAYHRVAQVLWIGVPRRGGGPKTTRKHRGSGRRKIVERGQIEEILKGRAKSRSVVGFVDWTLRFFSKKKHGEKGRIARFPRLLRGRGYPGRGEDNRESNAFHWLDSQRELSRGWKNKYGVL